MPKKYGVYAMLRIDFEDWRKDEETFISALAKNAIERASYAIRNRNSRTDFIIAESVQHMMEECDLRQQRILHAQFIHYERQKRKILKLLNELRPND